MPLTITPITPSLIPACTKVANAGFASTRLNPIMWPHGVSPKALSQQITRDTKALHETRNAAWWCVIDSSLDANDSVIAVGKWRFEDEGTYDELEKPKEEPLPGFNQAVGDAFFGMIEKVRKEIMGKTEYWHLVVLVTDPSHERKGAGRMLLEWGCKKADSVGLSCYLDATPTGRPLYERYGFEVQRMSTLELAQFGGEGEDSVANMIRWPGSGMNGSKKDVDDRGIKAV